MLDFLMKNNNISTASPVGISICDLFFDFYG